MENKTPAAKKGLPPFAILTIISVVAAVILAAVNMVTAPVIEANNQKALMANYQSIFPEADNFVAIDVPANSEGEHISSLVEAYKGDTLLGYVAVDNDEKGFNDVVAVTIGVGTDGITVGGVIGDSSFSETAGLGADWKDKEEYYGRLTGLDAFNGDTIDAKTGASLTSAAVLEAVDDALSTVVIAMGREPLVPIVTKGDGSKSASAVTVASSFPDNGTIVGTAAGAMGDVTVTVTLADGKISEFVVDASNETPTLGGMCAEESFTSQFIGKTMPLDASEIDMISGATLTSTAVVNAANSATEPLADGQVKASAQGLLSAVTVVATLDDNGTITALTIDASGETEGLGQEYMKEDFTSQFIGKTIPVDGIEAISGATVTYNAVMTAVNSLGAEPAAEEAAAEEPAAEEAPAAVTLPEGAQTATAQGLLSEVTVAVETDDAGTITALTVDASGETEGLGQETMKEAFTSQFIGKTVPVEGIETISGATVTSNAVITAVNSLDPVAMNAIPEGTTEVITEYSSTGTATAQGLLSEITVTVKFNADNTIAALTVDASGETEGLGQETMKEAFTNQFIGKTIPVDGIETISGATVTSNAVITAVNSLAPIAEEAPAAGKPLPRKPPLLRKPPLPRKPPLLRKRPPRPPRLPPR